MVASDGSIVNFGEGMPHPRNYRAFTRVLTKYVKEEEIISLEEAINKMSYLPAWKLGLQDRGLIKSGFKADINVFDFWNLKCESDFSSPHGYSKGMEYVLVNGEFVIYEKEFTKALPGEVLKKQFIK
jgi:N-acyl-D-aspartate/D-glutamate deacylase